MRDVAGREMTTRVRGRAALERSLRLLLIRTHRYGRHRARTAADRQWCARAIDGLTALLCEDARVTERGKRIG